MTGFWGMDTAQVDDFGALLNERRGTLDTRLQDLRSLVDGIVGSQWVGPDADGFGQRFGSEVNVPGADAIDRMQGLFNDLTGHVEAQDEASAPGDGGPATSGSAEEKSFGEKFWDKFVENLIPSPMGAASTLISAVHNLPSWMLENAPRAFPILGDVYTGLLSGAQRFGNESHLPLGERIGRAVVDGALTGLGSFLGGTIGSIGGAFLGVLAGGGSVGAAGAAAGAVGGAGVGAIPGALAGAGTGAVVGGVAGGVIGDIAGGYVGSAAGNALASAFLD